MNPKTRDDLSIRQCLTIPIFYDYYFFAIPNTGLNRAATFARPGTIFMKGVGCPGTALVLSLYFLHCRFLFFCVEKNAAGKGDKEPSLMRMGSLNSKVKKPSVLSASGRAITRMKSWGSADNIPDRAMNLMPPPKTFPKKKKSRKHTDIIG
ncbi:uncharacterized protein CEXT_580191 [Caerostris extrusa]|uniref:Uncharacterized protein n=1 Tax=Caerostris extrusa TaxID=172846 RepID=A0AAV4RE90_CAEEX|nr:uncharacterized protein CEXT_580191 [Caerostris extrusa]